MLEVDTNQDDKITFEEFIAMMGQFKKINLQIQRQWSC